MGVDTTQYRRSIGTFDLHMQCKYAGKLAQIVITCKYLCLYKWNFSSLVYMLLLLYCCGDVHKNPGPSGCCNMHIVHVNVRSLKEKIDVINLELGKYDVICITESWLHPGISDSQISIPGFQKPFRNDRATRGGGVAVYVKNYIYAKRIDGWVATGLEAIWVQVKSKKLNLLIGTFYRADRSIAYWNTLEDSIATALDENIDTIILGDFNSDYLTDQSQKIKLLESTYGLKQLIRDHTRITANSRTLIDLMFTTRSDIIKSSGVLDPICSDHCPIYTCIHSQKEKETTLYRKIYNYTQTDVPELKSFLKSINWDNLFRNKTIDGMVYELTNSLRTAMDKYIPNKTVAIRNRDAPWMKAELRFLIRKRNRQHKKAKLRNSTIDWNRFKQYRNNVVAAVRKAKREYVMKIDNKINSNHCKKHWWHLVKQYLKGRQDNTNFPPVVYNNMIYDSIIDIANAFNNYFTEQSKVDNPNKDILNGHPQTVETLDDILLSQQEVQDILLSIDVSKANGPDDVSNRLLKMTAIEISKPLTEIFNTSLQHSYFPLSWKEATVCPIHKKGSRSECSNYRPVALLSCIAKVFEKCTFKYVFNFFRDNNILTKLQSGFMPGDSTGYQLISLYNVIAKALDEGEEVRAVFCDVSKAFDKVWHKGLIYKLKLYGIRGNLLNWFTSYLENRSQRVVIQGTRSTTKYIEAGVPQGSVLGPLLFLVYINDIVENINCNIRLFADDTSIYITVDNPTTTANTLNTDLNTISKWAEKWQVNFNPKKMNVYFSLGNNTQVQKYL